MTLPFVSFVTWNRMGLTVRNLTALLNTKDDFELHIVDNNSLDDTWMYLESIKDDRIKSRTRFDVNRGPIYAVNYNLSKRKKDQFFITIDNDVNILTPNWVSKFLTAFKAFPGLGLLGAVRTQYYERYRITAIKKQCDGLSYHMINRGFVEGCCQCLHPDVLNQLGYWSEENCMGDVELCQRILKFTPFKIGYFPDVEIEQVQSITCDECTAKTSCTLCSGTETCFERYKRNYVNPQFKNKFFRKYENCLAEMDKGIRTPCCASVHDEDSMKKTYYNIHMAEENFKFYMENANYVN